MWRYVKEAFWAHAQVPLVGPLPFNALAVLGTGILGCAVHPLWLIGVGLETAYLFVLATHPRFQRVVAARELERTRKTDDQIRHDRLDQLTADGRARLERLEAKIGRIAVLYRTNDSDNLLLDSSLEAVRGLGALQWRLRIAERNLQTANQQFDEKMLAGQSATLERELAGGEALSAALRQSKQATLELTRKRLLNARRRAESLAEIQSDLARIEAQVDLALEDAGLEGTPAVVTANLNLLNRILESNSALQGGELPARTVSVLSVPEAEAPGKTPVEEP